MLLSSSHSETSVHRVYSLPPRLKELVELLNDGEYHSGQALGEHFGISRAAIWKMIQQFQAYQLPLVSVTGKGYALQAPIDWLKREKIEVYLDPPISQMIQTWSIFDTLPSTSRYLMDATYLQPDTVQVCLAEHQSGGYGRRGQAWASPLGHNLYLSLSWHTERDIQDLSGLNIALGVSIVKALQQAGIQAPLQLKWPNDLFVHHEKLAGVLIETRCTANDLCHVVASCGLNTFIPPAIKPTLDKPVTDLTALGESFKRNALAGYVINAMLHTLKDWKNKLSPNTIAEWNTYDLCAQKEICIYQKNGSFKAQVIGIDPAGRLLIKKADGSRDTLSAGDFSIQLSSAHKGK
jgi:BirA family transcriptional regulator, biotin operon repressor / biotin---[acetyl-CoA-carboxylase] ligase